MRIVRRLAAVSAATLMLAVGAIDAGHAAAAGTVLFIGNSFTLGTGSDVAEYRRETVTDLNDEGDGGVAALFKTFVEEAGFAFDVAVEAHGGVGLDFHLRNAKREIGSRRWDVVVAQSYSTLDEEKPRDAARLIAASRDLADLLRARNPKVALFLTSTWSRPDQVYLDSGAWAGTPIQAMGMDIRAAYDRAASAAGAAIVPVGEAFNRAIAVGFADGNPYDGIEPGKVNLWTFDHYHASTYGYYLEALMVFGRVTGRDPRSLGNEERAGMELGLSRAQVGALQQIAGEELDLLKRPRR